MKAMHGLVHINGSGDASSGFREPVRAGAGAACRTPAGGTGFIHLHKFLLGRSVRGMGRFNSPVSEKLKIVKR